MKAFITVGTTEFDELFSYIDCHEFIDLLIHHGFKKLVIQMGRGIYQFKHLKSSVDLEIQILQYVDVFTEYIKQFHFIIGHAGAGTLLEIISLMNESIRDLPLDPTEQRHHLQYPYVMVINETLQGNHQLELGNALKDDNFFLLSSPSHVIDDIRKSLQNPFLKNELILRGQANLIDRFPIYDSRNFQGFLGDMF